MDGEATSIAEVLFGLYAEDRKATQEYFLQGARAVGFLANQLQKYIGLPDYFEASDGEREPWVKIYSWDSTNDTVHAVDSILDLDKTNELGELGAAIGVTLAHSINSFPKTRYYIILTVLPKSDGSVSVFLGKNRESKFDLPEGSEDCVPFCEEFVRTLREVLTRSIYAPESWSKPGNGPIGFTAEIS